MATTSLPHDEGYGLAFTEVGAGESWIGKEKNRTKGMRLGY